MRIKQIDDDRIVFDNGNLLYFYHEQQCCEFNYADWKQIDELALDIDFDEDIELERCDYGFRFVNPPIRMFFVPCYSEQNGYYDNTVNIVYISRDRKHFKSIDGVEGME